MSGTAGRISLHLRSPGPRGPITIDCPRNDPQSIAFAFGVEHRLPDRLSAATRSFRLKQESVLFQLLHCK